MHLNNIYDHAFDRNTVARVTKQFVETINDAQKQQLARTVTFTSGDFNFISKANRQLTSTLNSDFPSSRRKKTKADNCGGRALRTVAPNCTSLGTLA